MPRSFGRFHLRSFGYLLLVGVGLFAALLTASWLAWLLFRGLHVELGVHRGLSILTTLCAAGVFLGILSVLRLPTRQTSSAAPPRPYPGPSA